MIRFLMSLVIIFLLVAPVAAQGEETYSSADGALTFNYPAGWVVWGYGGDWGYIANSASAQEVSNTNGQFLSGQVVISIHAIPYTSPEEIFTLEQWAESISAAYGADIPINTNNTVEPVLEPTINDDLQAIETTFIRRGDGFVEEVLAMVKLNGEIGLFEINMTTPQGETAQYHDLLLNIVSTVQYNPPQAGGLVLEGTGPAAIPGSGDVMWKQERLWGSTAENFGGFGSLSISGSGEIYIADKGVGVRVLDMDGNVLHTITNTELTNMDDVAVAGDGSLWVVNSYEGKVYHLDAQGNTLLSFGEMGSEPGQFADLSPSQIELGPDGNVYLFNYRTTEDMPAGIVTVYSPDGKFVREFPTDPNPNDMMVLFGFVQLAAAPDGTIYAGDLYTPAISAFAPDGTLLNDTIGASTLMGVQQIAVGSDGSIYVAGFSMENIIYKFDAYGNLLYQYNVTSDLSFTTGLGLMPDNSLIVAGPSATQDASVVLRLSAR